jgi:thiol-disulfide isomerase/thioredoxin
MSLVAWSFHTVRADEAADAATEEAAAEDSDAEEAGDESLLEIPNGDAEALVEALQELAQTQPEGETQDEQVAHIHKVLRTIVAAAERLIKVEASEEQEMLGHQYRLMALQGLVQLDAPKARERLEAVIAASKADPRPGVAGLGWQAYLQEELSDWETKKDEAKAALDKEIIGRLMGDGVKPLDVSIVQMVANYLDRTDDAFVADLLAKAIPAIKKSKDKDVREALVEANLEGMRRRLTLMGQPMEISGALLDGGEVEWESYRGKVVLVDFWATWCGPCRDEVPNILAMYEAYHDKGFDVLGVSLDDTPEDARSYIEEMKLPWASLYPEKEEDRGWNNPLSRYYGITGIPTAILVDQQGRVVHMNARGPYLQQQLQALLGEPAAEKAAEPASDEEASG